MKLSCWCKTTTVLPCLFPPSLKKEGMFLWVQHSAALISKLLLAGFLLTHNQLSLAKQVIKTQTSPQKAKCVYYNKAAALVHPGFVAKILSEWKSWDWNTYNSCTIVRPSHLLSKAQVSHSLCVWQQWVFYANCSTAACRPSEKSQHQNPGCLLRSAPASLFFTRTWRWHSHQLGTSRCKWGGTCTRQWRWHPRR